MSIRINCDQLLGAIAKLKAGFFAPLDHITQDQLNHIFAQHKMTIGQIAVHGGAWAEYHVAPTKSKPWVPVEWTCVECEYPLTVKFVNDIVHAGFEALEIRLNSIDDSLLEVQEDGSKGPGYVIYRLLLHFLAHGNQMSYLRSMIDTNWKFGGHFGDMATALIGIKYATDRDLTITGF
ncbi:MAG: hypothetical protein IH840_10680 [Candidatus Heimdallarchaeota archaeon]|nr:hypothetical protein [Candidatus Heimdallarchaeota archaeon]